MVLAMVGERVGRARVGKRMGHDETRDPDNHESGRSGEKGSTSHVRPQRRVTTRQSPHASLEEIRRSGTTKAGLLKRGSTHRAVTTGKGEQRRGERQRVTASRVVVRLDLRFICEIRGDASQRRKPEQNAAEETEQ